MNIKDAAKLTNLTNDTIRYYERNNLIMPVPRKENGLRDFQDVNIRQLNFVKKMRRAGVSIERLRDYVSMVFEDDDKTIPARKMLLAEQAEEMKSRLDDMQRAYDLLQYKIKNYENIVRKNENKLDL